MQNMSLTLLLWRFLNQIFLFNKQIGHNIKLHLMVRIHLWGYLRRVEYPFIIITPSSTLARNGDFC